MRLLYGYVLTVGVWMLAVAAAAGVTLHGQAQEREQAVERFQNRSDTGASFVGAYVQDVFKTERRLGARVSDASWRPSEFVSSSRFLGFPVGVLLDSEGRAVALSPDAPDMEGTKLASDRYPHLLGALAGRPTVSDVVPSAVEGKPIVAFALPLSTGRYRVLSMGFSLAEGPLQAFLERQPIAGTRGYIMDSSGATIVSAGGGAAPTDINPSRVASALKEPTMVDGRLLAATPIPGTEWTYMLDAHGDAVLAPAAADDGNQWGLLAIVALLSLGGLLVTRRAIAARGQARAERAEALEYRALYDPLTGLGNRGLLMDRLAAALQDRRRSGYVGIGFCDVDYFKRINDTHGHHAGDEVLKEVAQRLRGAVRIGDTVSRMGGDEFIVLLTEVGSVLEAEQVMERARRAVAQPIEVDGVSLSVGLSGGLALSRSGDSADTLLRNADAALYGAKQSGRGRCVVYHTLLDGVSVDQAKILAAVGKPLG